ncbi:MAG: hypothetical protein Hyperionvirus9_13 [Hyperionvirus sp.]|uniref:Uncharacterized protein n=1 Tax=Hyperionvirus sp. TaxID=2487770 RepID=A0A3G5A8J7_9VIRU|nr:MAG: hypothetical protein Hyperionvirus9_13 [Hyperionvirus sp.]
MDKVYFVIFIILGILALVLTAYALVYGESSKPGIWTLYAINIVMFALALWFLYQHSVYGVGLLLLLQFILYIILFVMTNNAGNLTTPGAIGTFTAANVFVVLQYLAGIALMYHIHIGPAIGA